MRATTPIMSLERLRRYRLEAGLSERALARATAMTGMSITALEEGRNHDELSLRQLVRIANALNVDPAALFSAADAPEQQADDVRVEAALAAIGRFISPHHLAAGLSWTIDRTTSALERLQKRLAGTGQRLATRSGKVKLIPAAGTFTDAEEASLANADLGDRGLSLAHARLLREAIDGQVDAGWHRRANANDLLAEGTLLRLGFAQLDEGRLKPTADVLFGLAPSERQ